jgi:hypothetical protein
MKCFFHKILRIPVKKCAINYVIGFILTAKVAKSSQSICTLFETQIDDCDSLNE